MSYRAPTPEPRGSHVAASWIGWILPGGAHVILGEAVIGAIAFVSVMGLFLLGVRLSDGMVFEFLDADLRGPVAGLLTPEVGNPAGLVYFMKAHGFGPPMPRPWPEHIHLGAWLMASSGLLNLVFVVHANTLARLPRGVHPPRFAPASHVLAGWLVPGLGHWLQGRRRRALVVFVLLVGLLVLGTVLAAGSNLDRERHFYYWSGQFLTGLPAAVLEIAHGHAKLGRDLDYVDVGLVFGCVAGLLNVLCLLDVHAFGLAQVLETNAPKPVPLATVTPGATTLGAATASAGASSPSTPASGGGAAP